MKIITHFSVDSDNVIAICTYLIKNRLEATEKNILFVPADCDEKNTLEKIYIDIGSGENKHPDGLSYVSSYFSNDLSPEIIEEVKDQESKGFTSSRASIASIINALKYSDFTDIQIIQHFYPIVKGWMLAYQVQKDFIIKFETMDKHILFLGKAKFLVIEGLYIAPPEGIYLNQIMNFSGLIYKNNDGWGILRFPRRLEPNLNKLSLAGWFSHPQGFLFCWGSRKNPKTIPPPQFKTLDEFLTFLQDKFPSK